jgi:hypothetical protein
MDELISRNWLRKRMPKIEPPRGPRGAEPEAANSCPLGKMMRTWVCVQETGRLSGYLCSYLAGTLGRTPRFGLFGSRLTRDQ